MRLKDAIIEYLDYMPGAKFTNEMVPLFELCESEGAERDDVQSIVPDEWVALVNDIVDSEGEDED